MDALLTCTACGLTGYGVRTRIVEAPEDATVRVGDFEVPQRYVSEPRCIDAAECLERQPITPEGVS